MSDVQGFSPVENVIGTISTFDQLARQPQQEQTTDDLLLMRELARESFQIMRDIVRTSGTDWNLWSALVFLADYCQRSGFPVKSEIGKDNKLAFIIEHNLNNDFIALFGIELMMLVLEELSNMEADTRVTDNTITFLLRLRP